MGAAKCRAFRVMGRPGHTRAGFAAFRLGGLSWEAEGTCNDVGKVRPVGQGTEALVTRAGWRDALSSSLTQCTVDTSSVCRLEAGSERPSPLEDQGGP